MSFFEEISPEMDRYLENHASSEPDILKRLRKETFQKTTQPHMISGYLQGRLLAIISKMLQPKNILEIGTFTGYATLCLTEGLAKEGKITTIDVNEELAYLPKKYFQESEFSAQIDFQLKDAKDFLKETDEFFDLVFIDADKENYLNYFELILPKMNKGGIILSDNVLWSGKVLEPVHPNDLSTKIIMKYNDLLKNDPRVETVLLPIRDGLTVSRVL